MKRNEIVCFGDQSLGTHAIGGEEGPAIPGTHTISGARMMASEPRGYQPYYIRETLRRPVTRARSGGRGRAGTRLASR